MIDIIAFDPGTTNFAVSRLQMRTLRKQVQYRILYSGMFYSTINSLNKDVAYASSKFDYDMKYWLDGATLIGAERFMSRGLRGSLGEKVSFMLGRMTYYLDQEGIPYMLLAAVTWKNSLNRVLKPLDLNLKDLYKVCKAQPHQLDATLIGLYVGALHMGQPPFSFIRSRKDILTLFHHIETKSSEKLIKRKAVLK